MNKQEIKTKPAGTPPRTGQPSSRPPQRRRPNPALLRLLRNGMLVLASLIVLVGLLLLILPSFRVQTITVKGASYYTPEQISAASGIEVGQEILGININEVCQSIWEKCIYVDEVSIKLGLNDVTIEVTERSGVLYTEFCGRYFSIDADDDFRVLEQSYDESLFADFLKTELPAIASVSVGKPIKLENPDADLSYVNELIHILDAVGVLPSVTSIDCSGKYSVSYVMNESCRIRVGRVADMEQKLEIVNGILEIKGDVGGASAVVDVSDLKKPTFRLIEGGELLMAD